MTPYRAAIFDLDGTLLNTLDDLHASTNEALTRFGYPTRTREEVRSFVGNGVELLIRRALPDGAADPRLPEVLACFTEDYTVRSRTSTRPYPGMAALLADLRAAGVHVAVVSNKFDAAVKELCAFYFPGLVEVAVGESPTVARKPAPDSLLQAMQSLGVTREECVYIGDSDVDAETARRAAVPCIGVLWGFRDRACLAAAGADRFAQDEAALRRLLLPLSKTAPEVG